MPERFILGHGVRGVFGMAEPTTPREPRTGQVQIRVSKGEEAALRAAAEREHRTLSDWARLVLLGAASCAVGDNVTQR